MTKQELQQAANELAVSWVLVGTNSGTYGPTEACRKVGSGDPAFSECKIYEQVGTGKRRVSGPDPDEAPGRIRRFTAELAEKQRELRELRKQLVAAR